jgi:hypothetical protein
LYPIVCSEDGIPYLRTFDPQDYRRLIVFSLEEKSVHRYSIDSIPNLYDVDVMSYFAGSNTIGIVVHATRDDRKSPQKMILGPGLPSRDVYPGEHHAYLVELDRSSGSYKRTVDLPASYRFWRVAELSDGSFLALAYDTTNSVPRLLILDSDGKIVRTLEIPQSMSSTPQLQQGLSGDMLKRVMAQSSMSWWNFAQVRHRILIYQMRTRLPVLEVGPGGIVREVPLRVPQGYELNGVVSANDRWLMQYRKEGMPDDGAVDARPETKNFVLYEVDPNDGSLKRQIDLVTGRHFDIACEQDGVLIGFSMDEKFLRITAEIGR